MKNKATVVLEKGGKVKTLSAQAILANARERLNAYEKPEVGEPEED